MKLRDMTPGDRFTAKFYNERDELSMFITGEYLCPSEEFPHMCVVRLDGCCVGYEPAGLEVERIDHE